MTFLRFTSDCRGNVAIITALCMIPLMLAAGAAIDYSRIVRERSAIQNAADAALLAGARETLSRVQEGKSQATALSMGKAYAKQIFNENVINRGLESSVGGFDPSLKFVNGKLAGDVNFPAQTSATFMKVANLIGQSTSDVIQFNVFAGINIGASSFAEVHFVIDNSASMGIGATNNDINIMAGAINCAFACHAPAGSTHWSSTYQLARSAGATLRIDVVKQSIDSVLSKLQGMGYGANLKVSIHTFSNTLKTLAAPTDDLNAAKSVVQSVDLIGEWGQGGTSFDFALNQLATKIGTSGSGTSSVSPRKIVIVLTDGIATNVKYELGAEKDTAADGNFVRYNPSFFLPGKWGYQGFNPDACRRLKNDIGAVVYALNVEYVVPSNGVLNSGWEDGLPNFSGTLKPRIEDNMKRCATSQAHYYPAETPDKLNAALEDIANNIAEENLRLIY